MKKLSNLLTLVVVLCNGSADADDVIRLVKDINPQHRVSSIPTSLTALGDQLVFAADDGMFGREL